MKELSAKRKDFWGLSMFFLVTIGFTYLIVSFSMTIKDEPTEEVIEIKYSKKGLYLFPRYEVLVSNSGRPSTVTREQFDSISSGDTISGYKKNPEDFVTEKDIQFEISLGLVILVFLYLGSFAILGMMLANSKFIKKTSKRRNALQMFIRVNFYGFTIIYLLAGMTFTVLIATNVFHKVNKSDHTEVEGFVAGGDYHTTHGDKGESYTTYELFIHYEDSEGTEQITKKAVTGNTYNKYDLGKKIPIVYRNNNEHDVFVQTKGLDEIYPAFINLFILFIYAYLASAFFIIRTWLRRNNKKTEQEEEEETISTI